MTATFLLTTKGWVKKTHRKTGYQPCIYTKTLTRDQKKGRVYEEDIIASMKVRIKQ